MQDFDISRRLAAEVLGTALLLATVVGSGIMGDTLASGNSAIALIGNSIATGAILVVLITIFGGISGAHFNPAVTVAFLIRREIPAHMPAFVLAQFAGAMIAVGTMGWLLRSAASENETIAETVPVELEG